MKDYKKKGLRMRIVLPLGGLETVCGVSERGRGRHPRRAPRPVRCTRTPMSLNMMYDVSIMCVNRRNDVQRSRAHRENCEHHVTFLL